MSDQAETAESLTPLFRIFHDEGYLDSTPVYKALAKAIVEEPGLAASLLAAPPTERLPNLLFAAVQFLLRHEPERELAAYYPSLGGTREPDGKLIDGFRSFVRAHDGELREIARTRTTQTNEARRAAVIRPALARAQIWVGERDLALVEVGCSSGLMLIADRYAYRYRQPDGAVLEFGEAVVPDLVLDVEVRGGEAVPRTVAEPLRVASRVGIDRNPIAADDQEQTDWLRACVWPEHLDRLRRLDAALEEARKARLDLRRGDLLDLLPQAVVEAPDDAVVCVLSSHVMPYLTGEQRADFADLMARLAESREIILVLNEFTSMAAELGVEAPEGDYVLSAVVDYRTVTPGAVALAKVDQHGAWLEWLG